MWQYLNLRSALSQCFYDQVGIKDFVNGCAQDEPCFYGVWLAKPGWGNADSDIYL